MGKIYFYKEAAKLSGIMVGAELLVAVIFDVVSNHKTGKAG